MEVVIDDDDKLDLVVLLVDLVRCLDLVDVVVLGLNCLCVSQKSV